MNNLEREGVELVVTINNLINTGIPVNLSRKDSLVLRFYLSLNSLRTNLIRGMIKKFERPVMNSVRGGDFTAKGVYEESINILVMMHRKLKSEQDWRATITMAETKSRLFQCDWIYNCGANSIYYRYFDGATCMGEQK